MNGKGLNAFVAMGLVGTMATVAMADPNVVNITGATLLKAFVSSPASTRDYIDVNHDGITLDTNLGIRQQLAPDLSIPVSGTFPSGTYWLIHYRAVGSVNGLKELLLNGRTFFTGNSTNPLGFPVAAVGASDAAYMNRTIFTAGGVASGAGAASFNAANPGGFPWLTTTVGTVASPASPQPVFPGAAPLGLRADITPLDVPTLWATTTAGPAASSRTPGQPGYGSNPLPTRRKDGVSTAFGDAATSPGAYWSRLADLGTANLYDGVPANATGDTLFDTNLAVAPIMPVVNVGSGLQQIKMSELRHLYVTGRLPNGENLMALTRDAGSGTRNGWCNSIQIDPSYGAGENIGAEAGFANDIIVGPNYSPSNKSGGGGMRTSIRNSRLGVGYLGGSDAVAVMGANNQGEVIGVQNDTLGGTQYVRPTAANIMSNNNANTWRIAGPAQLVTFGDPEAETVGNGGSGRATPRMRNPAAAAYVNNITRSVAAFSLANNQSAITNAFSPGEAAAVTLILPASVEYIQDTLDIDDDGNLTEYVPNPNLVPSLRDWEIANSLYSTPANAPLFAAFNTTKTGKYPTRQVIAGGYSDFSAGVPDGGVYKNQAGVNQSFSADITPRNKITGDFNFDGVRNINDTAGMIAAWRDRAGLGAWDGVDVNGGASDTSAVIEVLGDFNSDGNFDSKDVRYFADGLAIAVAGPNAGKLDRKAGFTAVDNASLAQGGALNYFGTTKATGAAYAAGDARGDIAGARVTVDTLGNPVAPYFKATPGFGPSGFDGAVNGWDITYVYTQFKKNLRVGDGTLNWSNLSEAEGGDLSADMTGDLVVDQNDVNELVQVILGTTMGDVNLDGVQNAADETIITTNLGMTNAVWQDGDLDGDGTVTGIDLSIYQGGTRCGAADLGKQGGLIGFDGLKDNNDFVVFIDLFFNNSPLADFGKQGGIAGPDGQWDNNDFIVFIDTFFQPCN